MIDFRESKLFKDLIKKMGIEKGKYAEYEGLISNPYGLKLTKLQIDKLKSGEDVEITIDQLDFSEEDPILRVGKANVILYIRDQYYPGRGEYKYHIAWCNTLEKRKRINKINRYVITRQKHEEFVVNKIDSTTHEIIINNTKEKMRVCKSCLNRINYKGYSGSSYSKKEEIYNNFSLEDFLKENSSFLNTRLEEKDMYTPATQPKNEYPDNWDKISRVYRQSVKWKCEKCNKDCSYDTGYLHVHHKNSNKFDVSNSNLIALCKDCHAKEHGHMF